MIKSSKHVIQIQIDYFAIIDIIKQNFIISTTSIIKINVKLIYASQFLRQFNLNIKHKFEKKHIISNALSKLINLNFDKNISSDHFELDALHNTIFFIAVLIKMKQSFHDKCIHDY